MIGVIMVAVAVGSILNNPLWEESTRFLFLGIWLVLTGLLGLRARFRRHFKYFLISTAAGFLLGIGFPPSPALPLIFIAFVPIFYLEKKRKEQAIGQWPFFFYLFNAFYIWNIWSTFWIANSALGPAVFAFVVNSLLMVLTVLWANWIHRKTTMEEYFGLVFTACWIIFEFMHLRWDLSWPWLNLGNALAEWPMLAQWYEYTGVFGGTLWILLINYLIFRMLVKYRFDFGAVAVSAWIRLGFWLVIPVAVSLFIFQNRSTEGREIRAVVVNPNVEPHYEKFTQSPAEQVTLYNALLEEALAYEPALVVFPETIVDDVNLDEISLNPVIRSLEEELDRQGTAARILLGVAAYRIFHGENAPDRPSVRSSENRRSGATIHWEAYNSAVLLGNDTVPVYHKQKLVPGAEIFPYPWLLFFVKPWVEKLGGSVSGFGRPPSQNVFEFEGIRISPVICYESVYGELMRQHIARGANLLGVVTNDGWWGNTAGYKQHDMFAALRAIEYRRDVVRSANMGRNGAFDSKGMPLTKTNEYGERAVIPVELTLHEEVTFYARWGDYLGRFSLFLLVFITLKAAVNTFTGKKNL